MKNKLITVIGTTASGKSDLGIHLARRFNGEVISCDSRQIYRGLDLGTGKVTAEEQQLAKHHLIDIKNPNQPFSLAEFQKLAYESINDILARGKVPFLVGGTGLYCRAVTEGYNFTDEPENIEMREEYNSLTKEELIKRLEGFGEGNLEGLSPRHLARRLEKREKGIADNVNIPLYDVLQLAVTFPREVLYKRIEERLDKRLALGMVDEVKTLIDNGATDEFLEGLGLEYRYTLRYIRGVYDYETYREELFKQIRHFAKRQMTWFKKEKNCIWLDTDGDFYSQAEHLVEQFLSK